MAELVTVFGGSGLIGRHTVRALAAAGYRIRVAVREPNHAMFLLPAGHVGQIQIVKCNVRNEEQVAAALRGADAAVNLVGVLYSRGKQSFQALHKEAPAAIARAAKAAGVKTFIHVSTMGISPESESAYSRSKAQGDEAARAEFPATTLIKPSIIFGPEDDFFNKFANLARYLPALPLIGGGNTKFQPVFVGDVADAILASVRDPATRGKTYELGGPDVLTFKQILEIILKVTERKRLLVTIPFWFSYLEAFFLQFLPKPLLTPDQVTFLKSDNVVTQGALTFADLGIVPDSLEAVLPSYLWRFRARGQYSETGRLSAAP
ncbi:MAG TPA: complex I NDUFA9 subunit family protein [Rhizomicrobium sp.]|nr:complex I NDUFA9 subunit family protein [Rhizomicrobium sp.]